MSDLPPEQRARQSKHAEEVRVMRTISRATGVPYSDLKRFARRFFNDQSPAAPPVAPQPATPALAPVLPQLAEGVTFLPRPFVLQDDGTLLPTPLPTMSSLTIPDPPESGIYVLASDDGELYWQSTTVC